MHALKVSHNILDNACAWMHTARRNALITVVTTAIEERRLTVTGLGRAIESDAKEKHCIKRSDRLIGNEHLYHEFRDVYHSFLLIIIGVAQRPVILVDWSDLDSYKRHFLLRASVAVDGRALSLYEEVHGLNTKEKPETHRSFLNKLKTILPEGCRPIVVTDAGFRTPWFTQFWTAMIPSISILGYSFRGCPELMPNHRIKVFMLPTAGPVPSQGIPVQQDDNARPLPRP